MFFQKVSVFLKYFKISNKTRQKQLLIGKVTKHTMNKNNGIWHYQKSDESKEWDKDDTAISCAMYSVEHNWNIASRE